jgi:hypothetical protein
MFVLALAHLIPAAAAQKEVHSSLPAEVMQARSALIICECPRGLAVAERRALQELLRWGRFRIVEQRKEADLVFLFSGNEYLGDYLTRDGPDKRPVAVDFTIMTLIDPHTGANLWSDSRRWGAWRVDHATKDLIAELKEQIEDQTKKWTLNDILMCSVTPQLAGFAHLTAEAALAKSEFGVRRIAGSPDRLAFSSGNTPEFCQQAQLIIGPDNRVAAFEVVASLADSMDVDEVLQHADQFDFTGGKYSDTDQTYFSALSKDKKILVQFDLQGHRSVLSRVRFFY